MLVTIFEELSNREKALLTWLFILFALLFCSKKIATSILNLIGIYMSRPLLIPIVGLVIYAFAGTFILFEMGFWKVFLLKDTIIWLFAVSLPLLMNFVSGNPSKSIKTIFKKSIQWTILIEFIVNLYVFGYWVEVTIIPVSFFLLFVKMTAKKIPEGKYVITLVNLVLGSFLLYIFSHTIFSAILGFHSLFTIENLKTILIGPVLTSLALPYLYLMALISAYQLLNFRINNLTTDKKTIASLRKKSIKKAGIRLNRIHELTEQAILALRSGRYLNESFR
jgi:hypothetical protein